MMFPVKSKKAGGVKILFQSYQEAIAKSTRIGVELDELSIQLQQAQTAAENANQNLGQASQAIINFEQANIKAGSRNEFFFPDLNDAAEPEYQRLVAEVARLAKPSSDANADLLKIEAQIRPKTAQLNVLQKNVNMLEQEIRSRINSARNARDAQQPHEPIADDKIVQPRPPAYPPALAVQQLPVQPEEKLLEDKEADDGDDTSPSIIKLHDGRGSSHSSLPPIPSPSATPSPPSNSHIAAKQQQGPVEASANQQQQQPPAAPEIAAANNNESEDKSSSCCNCFGFRR